MSWGVWSQSTCSPGAPDSTPLWHPVASMGPWPCILSGPSPGSPSLMLASFTPPTPRPRRPARVPVGSSPSKVVAWYLPAPPPHSIADQGCGLFILGPSALTWAQPCQAMLGGIMDGSGFLKLLLTARVPWWGPRAGCLTYDHGFLIFHPQEHSRSLSSGGWLPQKLSHTGALGSCGSVLITDMVASWE